MLNSIEVKRVRNRLTKEELAKKLGVSVKTYYNWIKGTNPIPSDALIEMAELCDSSTDYLLGLSTVKRWQELVVKPQIPV